MARRFYGSINVSDIDKGKLVSGKKGKYLPVTIWLNEKENQFGTILSIQQDLSEQERKSGAQRVYLGNFKEADGGVSAKSSKPQSDDDDLPF